jgi:hypothetical protein
MSDKLICLIRRGWVEATPEEIVRQTLLKNMVDKLGYPSSLLNVEGSLERLVFGQATAAKRRVDIVSYIKADEGLLPLLLIECKAKLKKNKALLQVSSYNHFLKAAFFALADNQELLFFKPRKEGGWVVLRELPHFQELCLDFKSP